MPSKTKDSDAKAERWKAWQKLERQRKRAEKLLKPCPLCSAKARILPQQYLKLQGWSVGCLECGLVLRVLSAFLVSAVCGWNYRDGKLDTTADDYGDLGGHTWANADD